MDGRSKPRLRLTLIAGEYDDDKRACLLSKDERVVQAIRRQPDVVS